MPVGMSRRERKKVQTRDALVAAGVRLFAERGFAGTTVEDITGAADTSPRTFFRYFSSKEDLLVADIGETAPLVRESFESASAQEPILHSVRRAAMALAGALTRPESLAQRRLAFSIPEIRGRMLENQDHIDQAFVEEIAKRLNVDPELDPRPRVAAGIALGAVRAAVHSWVASDGTADPAGIVARTFDLVDSGPGSFGTAASSQAGS